ncbi:MAG: hydroxypyruvate isomerase [Acidobacteria bacterium]|nr:MAG: hydroxypyruvate isomerase [Acidobacteriota bacterium]
MKPRSVNRRDLLRAGALLPAGLYAAAAQTPASRTPPPYTLSINIEIMFRAQKLSRADSIRAVAAQGFKAYSFWSAPPDDRKAMLQAQKETGLTCVSIVGTGPAGGTTGFTRPGASDILLKEITERVAIAKEFGTPDLISFVGQIQDDVPWPVQRAGIVEGLKRAGDIAAAGGVSITIEPLSVEPTQRRRALDRAVDCYPVIAEVNHPNVKVCFDFYHLQRTEGNLTVNLREGFAKNLIKVVQIGDVPGRLEPGTGEINYPFLFAELRRLDYRGYLDTEMGTSSTPEHAMQVVRRMSEEN